MSNSSTPIRGDFDMTSSQIALVKRTLAADCTEDEFNLYMEVARRTKADPFRRHIYAVVYNKDDPKRRKMSLITGIDFYRVVAARNRDYRPDEEPATFTLSDDAKCHENPLGIIKAVVRCWKLGADNNGTQSQARLIGLNTPPSRKRQMAALTGLTRARLGPTRASLKRRKLRAATL